MRNNAGRESGTVQSVDRAVTILELLAVHGSAGVSQLARALGVHKSTASRLMAALERRQLVEQLEDRGRYRLGVGVLKLAAATSARLDLTQEARTVCRRLAAETG
jgi:IclR family transcriptional regulator, acetate operon repressor